MNRVERTGDPIDGSIDVLNEYTFFLSAWLNACYSVTSHLEERGTREKAIARAFRAQHSHYYRRATGLRHLATHIDSVAPGHHGYFPPRGFSVNLALDEPQNVVRGFAVPLALGKGARYYYQHDEKAAAIGDLCELHHSELRSLIDECDRG
jgi:hypothetical protein